MRLKLPWTIGAGVGAVALTAGLLFWRPGASAEALSPRQDFGSKAGQVAANGVVEGARPEVALRPEITGTIAGIPFRENQPVKAGTILVELENSSQKQKVALAQAELAVARAERAATHALFQQADNEYQRAKQLLQSKAMSAEQYDAVYYRKVHLQAQDAAAAGRLDMAQARLDLALSDLEKTRLRAPTDGHVVRVHAEIGELAGPTSTQPVLVFADLSRRRVRALIEELDAPRVKVGQAVTVTCDGLPGKEFHGKVSSVLPRMGKRSLISDAAEEYKDVYVREVVIDLEGGQDLVLNMQVQVRVRA
jgi:RND family efflux transporter MFP subunit